MCKFVQPITVIYKVYTKIHKSIKKIYIHKKILNYIWPLFPGTGIQKKHKNATKEKITTKYHMFEAQHFYHPRKLYTNAVWDVCDNVI